MRITSLNLLICCLFFGCSSPTWNNENGVEVLRFSDPCVPEHYDHYLVDVLITDSNDSIYLNSKEKGVKLELAKQSMDTTSSFFKALVKTCISDSIYLKLLPSQFFEALGGKTPSALDSSAAIQVNLVLRDALKKEGYVAYKKAFELEMIDDYLQRFKWNPFKDSATGVHYEFLKGSKQQGLKPTTSSLVYTISSIRGQIIFQATKDHPFDYKSTDKNLMPAIRFLAEKLKPGDKARAIFTSDMAYGSKGIPGRIIGYMPIVIEMECLDASYEKS